MKQEIFFHGTKKEYIPMILGEGILTEYGRATFISNPTYPISYSSSKTRGTKKKIEDYAPIIKEGVLVVVKSPKNQIRGALKSKIKIDDKKKIIHGEPNRFKTIQYGFFPLKKRKRVVLGKKYIVAILRYNRELLKFLTGTQEKVRIGDLSESKIKKFEKTFARIISNKKIQILSPRISPKKIAHQGIKGMVYTIMMREIRQVYFSQKRFGGWKIIPSGNHPVKTKSKEEIKKSLKVLEKIMKKKFISKEVKKEYRKLLIK